LLLKTYQNPIIEEVKTQFDLENQINPGFDQFFLPKSQLGNQINLILVFQNPREKMPLPRRNQGQLTSLTVVNGRCGLGISSRHAESTN